MNAQELADAIAYAPRNVKAHPDIRGHWTREGYFLCGACGARFLARGFAGEISRVVWADASPTVGVCVGCEPRGACDGCGRPIQDVDEIACRGCKPTLALRAELAALVDEDEAHFWRFARCERAKPFVIANPKGFARLQELRVILGVRR